jgi:hypothetical protein
MGSNVKHLSFGGFAEHADITVSGFVDHSGINVESTLNKEENKHEREVLLCTQCAIIN